MTSPYRVAHVIGSLRVGGAEKLLVSTLRELDKGRFESFVCCTGNDGQALRPDVEQHGIPVRAFGSGRFWDVRELVRLAAFFRKQKIDIVHTHLPDSNMIGRISASLACVPVVVSTIHNIFVPGSLTGVKVRIKTAVERFTARRMTTWLIAVSKAAGDSHVQWWGLDPARMVVIPPFIMLEQFEPTGDASLLQQKRDELQLAPGQRVVISVGSLNPKKGQKYLLDAAARVLRVVPDVRFLIVGDGPIRDELLKASADAGLASNVTFTGVRRDIRELLAISDVFASSSLWEGLPQVFLEAMAMGKPVVATRVGGVPEVVDDGKTGLIVPPGDSEALAQALLTALSDPVRMQAMGTAGRERIHAEYGATVVVRKIEQLYESLLAGRPPLAASG
jgi:glycosyltransferase involved in cell wall biosynthesis